MMAKEVSRGLRGRGAGRAQNTPKFLLDIGVFMLLGWMAYSAWGFQPRARTFPLVIASIGAILAGTVLAVDVLKTNRGREGRHDGNPRAETNDAGLENSQEGARVAVRRRYYPLWLLAYGALIALIGMRPATALFLLTFLGIESRWRWLYAVGGATAACLLLTALGFFLNAEWPTSVLW